MGKYQRASEQAERRRRKREDNDGCVEMRIDVEIGGELLLSCGGLWSVEDDEYVDDVDACKTGFVIRPHPGQAKAMEWFAKWIAVHAGRRDDPPAMDGDDDLADIETDPSEVFSALFAGGRRGGKTWIAAAICALYAIQFPGSIIWVVSPARGKDDTKPDEIRRYMSQLLAPEWISRQTIATGWELINGSEIMLKSGHTSADPDAIKEGKCHLVWLNEGQKMNQRVYTVARGAISDHSGLVMVCANPPVEAKDQQWVTDFAQESLLGRRASVYIEFNPLENPHINRRALLSMRAELDDRTFEIEVLGKFKPPKDVVCYNWLRFDNEIKPPGRREWRLIDVTTEFLSSVEEGPGFEFVVGVDFQRIPYIGGPIYRIFGPDNEYPTIDNVRAFIVGEVALDGGDEVEWCDALGKHKLGLRPGNTLIVGDASGQWQHSRRRTADSPPPTWTGKGSFDVIRGEGWIHIVPPSRRLKKNPEITDRVRAFTSMVCQGPLTRRLFADPDEAPRSCKAIRDLREVHGRPSKAQPEIHMFDGMSYPIVRLFPRILRSGNTGPEDPVTKRVDRPDPQADVGVYANPRPPRKRGGWA